MQIQINWLLQKPTDLDLHCLQRQGISRFSRTRVNVRERKKIMFKMETRLFIFSYAYAAMKQVTLKPVSAFKGVYPGSLPKTNFKSLHANCISNTPSTIFSMPCVLKNSRNGHNKNT